MKGLPEWARGIVYGVEAHCFAGFCDRQRAGAGPGVRLFGADRRDWRGQIREGATRTDVSAEFDISSGVRALLDDAGFEAGPEGGGSLLLRRTVDTQGKSRAWVNGSPATAQQLRAIGEQLLDIHGQHAWQSLTRPDAVRGLLDAYAKVDTKTIAALWNTWRQSQAALTAATQAQDSLQSERERLAWQIGELEKLNPQTGEWSELNTSHSRLANGQARQDAAQSAVTQLAMTAMRCAR